MVSAVIDFRQRRLQAEVGVGGPKLHSESQICPRVSNEIMMFNFWRFHYVHLARILDSAIVELQVSINSLSQRE